MHTVKSKLCPNDLDFYLKVLPEYLAANGCVKEQTKCPAGLGYMTGTDTVLGTAKGPSNACESSCYTCVLPWKKRVFTCFSVSFHLLHCQARADVVAF